MSSHNPLDIQFPWAEAPAYGQRETIMDGLDWIRLPLPFALNHVNCWHLYSDDDSCLIDTGVSTKETTELWNAHANQRGWPSKLLVTHFHPDHSGLAGWFAERGASVYSSEIEWGVVKQLNAVDADTYRSIYQQWYSSHGVDQSYIDALAHVGNTYTAKTVSPPAQCQYLRAGDTIELGGRTFAVLTGQGHSPDMIMLHCADDNILIAADQVLPSITPNVSWMPHNPDANPLASFIACLEKLRELPEETLVLPSHGLPFTGLHQRIDFLLDHHQKRLSEIQHALTTEHTAAQLFPLLFKRKLDHQQLSFALGETLAHLIYLQDLAQVQSETRDGIHLYRAIK